MKIKNIILIFSFLSFTISNVNAQEVSAWRQFLKDSVYNSDDKNYVSYHKILNKKSTFNLFYSLKNKKYTLAKVFADTAYEEKDMFSPNLFQIVYDNYFAIFRLKDYLNQSFKYMHRRRNHFAESNSLYESIGIKYGELHYNHFPKFTERDISNKKTKKVKKGMEAINNLYEIFEKLEAN